MGAALPTLALQPVQMMAARFVSIALAATIIGITEKAIRRKIERGVWLEGKHWRKADGSIFIDTKAVEKWVETAAG